MTKVVKLEFLRHGPPHNQLLSPLTDYLAVCGDHDAVSVRLPFEHPQVLDALQRLRDTGEGRREALRTLEEITATMGGILAQIPGLIAELNNSGADAGVTQLRLVLSANELAMLPFEVAAGSPGLPGAGQPLSLQATIPLCITREVRKPDSYHAHWPRQCRVLIAATDLPSLPPVPLAAHVLAIRRAVDPWVQANADTDDSASAADGIEQRLGQHMVLLTEASPRRISEALATANPPFSHVHLLAHGDLLPARRGQQRFGIALHDDADSRRVDVIDGVRLAMILRPVQTGGNGKLATPSVVTLATCDSGNVGDVISTGASLAHELHRAGIPLVIASQFPLSFAGSVQLARLMYGPLLRGEDPREVLYDVRRQLRALVPMHHDWAGTVVYSALPADLPDQLREVRFERGRAAIAAAMSHLDALSRSMSAHYTQRDFGSAVDDEALVRDYATVLQRFETARKMLTRELDDPVASTAAIHGLLAGAEKRVADALHRLSQRSGRRTKPSRASHPARVGDSEIDWKKHLQRAILHYSDCFDSDSSGSWALVQKLALQWADGIPIDLDAWELAWLMSAREVDEPVPDSVWALNNLIELAVLASRMPPKPARVRGAPARIADFVARLLERTRPDDLDVHSLRRQLLRYMEGFLMGPEGDPARELAKQAFAALRPADG